MDFATRITQDDPDSVASQKVLVLKNEKVISCLTGITTLSPPEAVTRADMLPLTHSTSAIGISDCERMGAVYRLPELKNATSLPLENQTVCLI